ncbi:hypothetical protein WME94_05295 [Sorangium sp. So ce429]
MAKLAESRRAALVLRAVSDERGDLRAKHIHYLHVDSFAAVRASFMGGT